MSEDALLDRMTDTSKYTGSHKIRFDESGKGRGLEGRESVPKGPGHIPPLVSEKPSYVTGNLIGLDAVDVARGKESPKTKGKASTVQSSPRPSPTKSTTASKSSPRPSPSKATTASKSSPRVQSKAGSTAAKSSPKPAQSKAKTAVATSSPKSSPHTKPKVNGPENKALFIHNAWKIYWLCIFDISLYALSRSAHTCTHILYIMGVYM